ncbi:hypothetical protein KAI92_01875 [Candidatus Parcubacteria bacterium]|nr:hypothetical protein [Candidatus Parcubacteria bacterium]
MYKKIVQDNRGSISIMIVSTLLFSVLIAVIISSNIVNSGIKISQTQVESAKAYFAAEAGAEKILYETRRSGGIIETLILNTDDCEVCFTGNANDSSTVNACDAAYSCVDSEQLLGIDIEYYYEIEYKYNLVSGVMTLINKGRFHDIKRTVELSWQ